MIAPHKKKRYNKKNGNEFIPLSNFFKARTQTLIDHFEGDIGSLTLTKTVKPNPPEPVKPPQTSCQTICSELIELSLDVNTIVY